jgi:ferredoxin
MKKCTEETKKRKIFYPERTDRLATHLSASRRDVMATSATTFGAHARCASSRPRARDRARVLRVRAFESSSSPRSDGAKNDGERADRSNNAVARYKRRVPFVDYYEVLAVDPKANADEVKAAYRALQKAVHPDLAGEYASIAAALVNEANVVLQSPRDRASFDRDRAEWRARGDVAAEDASLMNPAPLSRWSGPARDEPESAKGRHDAVFVDESQCVGCLQCALLAPKTFFIETRHGCARAVDQWADGRDAVEDAAAACPVRCIHFVDRATELPLLERVAARLWTEGGGKIQVRSIQKFFTHRPVSTLDRVPFQLTGEPFLYGMALRRGASDASTGRARRSTSPRR